MDYIEKVLKKGEKEFLKKQGELKFLQILFKDLQNELQVKKRKVKKIFFYKDRIMRINRLLVEEKLRVKALGEELENPINVNKWKSIGSDNNDVYELMGKIQAVQKKLISQTEKIITQDLKIQNQKETIQNFEEIYRKNPGIKEAKQLAFLQRKLKNKIRKLKSVAAELNLYRFKQNTAQLEMEKYKEKIDA